MLLLVKKSGSFGPNSQRLNAPRLSVVKRGSNLLFPYRDHFK